jgi:hypothetical protein
MEHTAVVAKSKAEIAAGFEKLKMSVPRPPELG